MVDPSRVPLGTRPVERRLTRIENQANRLRRTLGLTFAAFAGGAIILTAVRNMARFEESIAVVRAATKATSQEFEVLRDRAQELGITTRFSATQAADAMVLLARAGFSVNETMTAVAETLLLAQAGGLGMAEAADITASSLRGFGLAAEETGRVTDVLTATANSANTNVSQLGQALKFVAPIARGLGQTIETTAAALGVLSDAGLKGTLAGTGLRRVLAELASPGRELTDVLTAAGLSADTVNPKIEKLSVVLDRLRVAGFDTADALEVFGQRGGPAFAVLAADAGKLEEAEKFLKDVGGEAKRVADIMDDTLSGALFRARSALEGFNLAVGEVFASPVLITFLNGVTEILRLAARNAKLLQIALVALAAGGMAKLASVILTAALPAMRSLALTMVLFRGNVIAATAAWLRLNTALVVGPFLAIAAAVAVATASLQFQSGIIDDIEKSVVALETDSGFAKFGVQIRQATQELNQLEKSMAATEKRAKSGGVASDAQIAQHAKLTQALNFLKLASLNQRLAEKDRQEREKRGADITEAAIKSLERRRDSLSALTQQAKDLVAFNEKIDRLEEQKASPTAEKKEQIRLLIEGNTALEIQQSIFQSIKGPQAAFVEEQKALNALLDKGVISQGEFNVKLQEMRDALAPTALATQSNSLEVLEKELATLEQRARVGDVVADKMELENRLREEGVAITKEVENRINGVINGKQILNDETQRQIELERELARQFKQEEKQLDRLERQIKSQQALNDEVGRLHVLFDRGRLSAEELALALENVQLKGLEASRSLEDGFGRAFLKMKQESEDLAAVGEKVANVFADNVTNALAGLAEDGKLSFKDLANSIVRDLARVLARLLVVQAVQSILGGGGGLTGVANAVFSPSSGSGTGGGGFSGDVGFRANGGAVQANRSFIVGEDGPELFRPNQGGEIVPNNQLGAQSAAPNIQIVNVTSEDDVPNAINDGGADDAIINAIARNKDRVSQVMQ